MWILISTQIIYSHRKLQAFALPWEHKINLWKRLFSKKIQAMEQHFT